MTDSKDGLVRHRRNKIGRGSAAKASGYLRRPGNAGAGPAPALRFGYSDGPEKKSVKP